MLQVGNLFTRQKLTGRLFFAATGAALVDLGNVEMVKQEPKINRAQQKSTKQGKIEITHEEPGSVDWRYSIKLDEYANPGLQLLHLATAVPAGYSYSFEFGTSSGPRTFVGNYSAGVPFLVGVNASSIVFSTSANGAGTVVTPVYGTDYIYDSDTGFMTLFSHLIATTWPSGHTAYLTVTVEAQQSAQVTTAINIGKAGLEIAPGQSVFVGYLGLTAFTTVACNGTNYVLNTDYTIDLNTGMLTAINTIGDGTRQITAVASNPGLNTPASVEAGLPIWTYQVLAESFVRGTARLHLFDQNDESDPLPNTAPRVIVIFSAAELAPTAWPEDDGEKWDSFTVELLATTAPTVQERQ